MSPNALRGVARSWAALAALAASSALLPLPAQAQAIPSLGGAFRPQAAPAPAPAPASSPNAAAATNPATGAAAEDSAHRGLRIVVIRGTRNLASIDGRVVQVGDKVNGMRVAQINANGVVLTGDGGVREELKVHPSASKLPPNSTRVSPGARP